MNNANIIPLRNVVKEDDVSLRSQVEHCLSIYFEKLDGDKTANLFELVMGQTEHALLSGVLRYTQGNRSKAAEYLGISRGTLRKKLREHQLDN
ncbi:MAG: hypothetical protein H0W44_01245 [Gammaproteobacteria bacterium]|nr:hypothetical protein [Gammaproteobacteria bacterium]